MLAIILFFMILSLIHRNKSPGCLIFDRLMVAKSRVKRFAIAFSKFVESNLDARYDGSHEYVWFGKTLGCRIYRAVVYSFYTFLFSFF